MKSRGFLGPEDPLDWSLYLKTRNVSPSCRDIFVLELLVMNFYFQLLCMHVLTFWSKKWGGGGGGPNPPPPPPPRNTHTKNTHTTITTRKKIDHSCSKALLSSGVRAAAIRSWRKRNGKQKTKTFKTREFPNSTLFTSEYGIITGLLKTVEFTLLSYSHLDFRLGPGSTVGEKRRKKNRQEPKKIGKRSELIMNGCCFTPFFAVFPT